MRKNIVAGNWKMNKNVIDAQQLMAQLLDYKKANATNCEVWIAPPSLYLMMARDIFENNEVGVFSQDMNFLQSQNGFRDIKLGNNINDYDFFEKKSESNKEYFGAYGSYYEYIYYGKRYDKIGDD